MKALSICSALFALAQASTSYREKCDAKLAPDSAWGDLLPATADGNRWIFTFDAHLYGDVPDNAEAIMVNGTAFISERVNGDADSFGVWPMAARVTVLISAENGWNLLHFDRAETAGNWTESQVTGMVTESFEKFRQLETHAATGTNMRDIVGCLAEVYKTETLNREEDDVTMIYSEENDGMSEESTIFFGEDYFMPYAGDGRWAKFNGKDWTQFSEQ